MAAILIPLAISAGASLLSRLLFPQPGTEGPRLNDLEIPASSYGSPIARGWGRFRLTGDIIWGTDIVEEKEESGGKGGPTQTTYAYYANFAVLLCQGPVAAIKRIWFNGELVYNNDPNANDKTQAAADKFARYFRFYPGDTTQGPDDLIQAEEGVDKTPAYRDFCYLVFENLPLEKYGNRLPTVSVEVIQSATPVPLSTIVRDLCLGAGLGLDQFDATELLDLRVTGFVINSVDSVRSHIEKLQMTHLFDVVDFDGKICFLKQCQLAPGLISRDDLGCYEFGSEAPSLFKETRLPFKELPHEVRLKYLNVDKDYEEAEEYARRTTTDPGNRNVETLEVPQVMSRSQAKTITEKLLYLALMRGIEYELFLPVNYLAYDPGRFMACELRLGQVTSFLVTKKELGANYLLRFEAVSYDPTIYDIEVSLPPPSYTPSQSVRNPGNTALRLLDIPLTRDTDPDNGLYVAAGGGEDWRRAALYVSVNGGSSYRLAKVITRSSTFGTCNTLLLPGPTGEPDTSNTLVVTLATGELVSVTPADLEDGANKALVGEEVIQFQTATLTGPDTYTLSHLLRGRRGTEWTVDGHGAGEQFCLLSGDLERVAGQVSDIGQERLFKAITDDQTLDDVAPISITLVGVSLKPYAPVNLGATQDQIGNINIAWTRRDRHAGDRTDYANFPLSEARERYQVDIYDGTSVVRTLSCPDSTVGYSAAAQIEDFEAVQAEIECCVYQMSGVVGRGTGARNLLIPEQVYIQPPAGQSSNLTFDRDGLVVIDRDGNPIHAR